ncbi:MAG: hypothetical protein WA760_16100, partial [Pseudolabrys sp.]
HLVAHGTERFLFEFSRWESRRQCGAGCKASGYNGKGLILQNTLRHKSRLPATRSDCSPTTRFA